jgi:hypothetical protein
MRVHKIPNAARSSPVFFYAGIPLIVTAALWATSLNDVSLPQIVAVFLLCWIPWTAYKRWSNGTREGIPLLFLVGAVYWAAYALPLFWLRHEINLVTGGHELSEEVITRALYLAVLGVAALGVGIRVAGRWQFMESLRPDIHRSPGRWNYLRSALLAAMCLRITVPISSLGGGGRQFLAIVETVVPSIAFVVLLRYYLRGSAIALDKALLVGYASVALIAGISSGWMGSFVGLAIMATGVYVFEKRRLPLVALVLAIPVVLFLQPGKEKFRQQYWREGASDSYFERFNFWMDSSLTEWETALSSPDQDSAKRLADKTLGRISLLQQTANVVEATPERVPYQHGRLYSYMLVTFVPRLFWPDKPSVNASNQWYQVAYRLTDPRDLSAVSIATGYLTESYINFGWFGPPLVLFFIGLFLGFFDKVFLRPGSGLLLNSIGVVLLPELLQVESQLAQYIAGFGQQVLVALITLSPMLDLHRNKIYRGSRTSVGVGPHYKDGRLLGSNRAHAEFLHRH